MSSSREEHLIVNIMNAYELRPEIIHRRELTREAVASIRSYLRDATAPYRDICEWAQKAKPYLAATVKDEHAAIVAREFYVALDRYANLPFAERSVREWTGVDSKPDYDRLQQAVGEWARATFRRSTPDTITLHLLREVRELLLYLEAWEREQFPVAPNVVWPALLEEVADIVLLVLHLGHRTKFSLFDVIEAKFQEVQTRQWADPDAQGVQEHIRTGNK